MKFINKQGKEPAKLITWKIYHQTKLNLLYPDPTKKGSDIWKYLDNHKELDALGVNSYSKGELKSSLVEDQGYICCYCGQRIESDYKTSIEHLNPKSKYKAQTYDYANLLASCDGGSSYKIHKVESGETLSSIAKDYNVEEDSLIEIYINIPVSEHIKKLSKLYDIKNLKAGDRLFIIPKFPKKHQHCDTKKGNKEIPLHPINPQITDYFTYLRDGKIDIEESNLIKTTVEVLGLNANPLLNAERRAIVKKAISYKRAILKKYKSDSTLRKQAIKKLCKKYNTKINNRFEPYCFVLVAALK